MRLNPLAACCALVAPGIVWAQVDVPSAVWQAGTRAAVWSALTPLVIAGLLWLLVRLVSRFKRHANADQAARLNYGKAPLAWSALALVAGLAFTGYRVQETERTVYTKAWLQFEQQVDRVEADLQAQFERVLAPLRGIRATHLASDALTRAEFAAWVASRQTDDDFSGIRGFGMIERVQRSGLAAFVAAQRRDGAPSFAVRSTGNAPDLFITKFIEPLEPNRAALGYDVGSEPVRRAAAESAMRDGVPVLTGRITLVQDDQKRAGYLYYLPLYAAPKVPVTEAERLRAFHGWTYAPVVLAELLGHTVVATQGFADFQVFDGLDLTPAALAFDSASPDAKPETDRTMDRFEGRMFSVTRPIVVGGNAVQLRAGSTANFERLIDLGEPSRVAFAGSSLSILVCVVLWMLLAGRARAEALSQSMSKDLQRLAMVAQRTSSAVVITDPQGHITWVNEGFTRITGYSLQEAMGQVPGQFLQSDRTNRKTLDAISADMRALRTSRQILLNRHKDGRDYWLDIEIQPLRDANGQPTGFMALESDITEIVEAREALARAKERADSILAATNVATWEFNLLTGEMLVNARFAAMMGYTDAQMLPDVVSFWQRCQHPDDVVRAKNAIMAYLRGQTEQYSCDSRVQRADGSWMWVLSRGRAMTYTPQGKVEWLAGIHTDITDAKAAETKLRDAEAFLERTGRVAGIGAWQVDLRTNNIDWNEQTCEIHEVEPGYKPSMEEALSYYPPDDQVKVQAAIQRAIESGMNWDLTTEFITATGRPRWVRSVGEVEFDDTGAVRLLGALQDVTLAYEAQRKIERSEAIFREAIDTINEAFVLYDPQDRLVFCNEKYRQLYALSADLIVPGATFASIVRGGALRGQYVEAIGRVDDWVDERVAVHLASNIELEQKLTSGRWLRIVERKLPDGHIVGFRVDITALKESAEVAESARVALAREQARLVNILEGTNVGTWEWNLQTGETLINERWARITGYTLQELEPVNIQKWLSQVHPDDLPQVQQRVKAHTQGETSLYESEARLKHKDGHWVWALDRGKISAWDSSGKPLVLSGTHMDITERKLADAQLAETTATLQAVLDSAIDIAVIVVGLDRNITVFNKGAENLLGYAAEEMLGTRKINVFIEPGQLALVAETLSLTLARTPTDDEVFAEIASRKGQQEWTFVRKGGEQFIGSISIAPMRDAKGETTGFVAVAYDVTQQKDYEESLRNAMRQAEQSSVAKSQFLANMSHEIRMPMNAILGMLKLLHNTPLSERQRDYAGKTEGAARSLLGLLNDILDFSKVEAGKMQLDPEPFALEALLSDLSVILSSNLGNKNVDLVFDIDPALPAQLVGDALRIKQILINLGGNAVKFTSRGEVVIGWKLLARHDDRVKVAISVRDSGIGIAPENQARIFEAFTQAESNTTRRFGGTGLGLVISTRLIRLMGGELELSSVVDQGSTFHFVLEFPLVELGVVQPLVLVATASTEPSAAVRVLLVDDNAVALASSAAMMRSMGWQVCEAASGEEALAQVQAELALPQGGFDALFVDWQMPGMDGWQTLRSVRRLYGEREVPKLVMLSGQGRELLSQRTSREQELLNAFLVKPLTPAMFTAALNPAHDATASSLRADNRDPMLRLGGMRLLVVEDNLINQQVAMELLSAEGALVTLADNGQLGVEAVAAAAPPFDVVLMDLQMPVMDGMAAARAIRQNPSAAALPIIAMTANAMASDREACLQAGMNDHVGKPFDLDDLVDVLVRHTGWKPRPPEGQPQQPNAVVPAGNFVPTIDWPAGIDGAGALARMGGNTGLLQRTMQSYLRDAARLPELVAAHMATGDREAAVRELHSFKGLSATLGVQALATLAAQAESLAKSPDQHTVWVACMESIRSCIGETLPVLESLAGRLQAPKVPVARAGQVLLLPLTALLEVLRASDMVAMELHAALARPDDAALEAALAPLDAAMADLDFDAAATACEALIHHLQS